MPRVEVDRPARKTGLIWHNRLFPNAAEGRLVGGRPLLFGTFPVAAGWKQSDIPDSGKPARAGVDPDRVAPNQFVRGTKSDHDYKCMIDHQLGFCGKQFA